MPNKKTAGKKGGFSLVPITLSQPIKQTDGFTNLLENPPAKEIPKETATKEATKKEKSVAPPPPPPPPSSRPMPPSASAEKISAMLDSTPETEELNEQGSPAAAATTTTSAAAAAAAVAVESMGREAAEKNRQDMSRGLDALLKKTIRPDERLSEAELLRLLDADSSAEIYELSDVLRASSLKLYAALVKLADERGRARVKNHELMSKAGIKGIATLYKQERWLMDLKLLEKKAKPGPHDGSLYTVYKLDSLPLPAEVLEKFRMYLLELK